MSVLCSSIVIVVSCGCEQGRCRQGFSERVKSRDELFGGTSPVWGFYYGMRNEMVPADAR